MHRQLREFGYYSWVRSAAILIRRALVAACLLLLAGCYSSSPPAGIDKPAKDFTVQDSDRSVTLSQLRGKIVVLNFWATWCPPCVDEMPSLVQMQRKLEKNGVTVLAVSVDDDGDAYHKFLLDHKVDLLTVRDDAKKSSVLYGTFKYPETYIIDRQGTVRRKFIGPVDWNTTEIVEYLSRL